MEYSPMMVLMLWALTPSDATSVEATVQEMPTKGMTVQQETYFTFNHGRPFVAEQDPLTGAILNLKTTPVVQDDYLYEEDEETDSIDRKDTPKIFTRNDIAQPSKDPDLHKFLNLPIHYSTSGKFPLISSSYANTKIQGHGAGSQSNHRLNPTTTTTVSPSYYLLKTPTTATTTTEITTPTGTSTTNAVTRRPSIATTTSTTTTSKSFLSYEYEYEYDYDKEPSQSEDNNKKSTTQTILDFFEKDYEFLGASGEIKNETHTEKMKQTSTDKTVMEEGLMIAPNTNIFIPAGYLTENKTSKSNGTIEQGISEQKQEHTTDSPIHKSSTEKPGIINLENRTEILTAQNMDTKKETTSKVIETKEQNQHFGEKIIEKTETTKATQKLEITPTTVRPKISIPFFPVSSEQSKEERKPSIQHNTPEEEEEEKFAESKPMSNSEQRPIKRPTEEVTTSRPGYPHLYKPSDVKSNKPIDMMPPPYRPVDYNQRPYLGIESVQSQTRLEHTSTQIRPTESLYKPQLRPSEPTRRPMESEQNYNKPLESGNNRPIMASFVSQKTSKPNDTPGTQQKPAEIKIPSSVTRPTNFLIVHQRPGDLSSPASRPFEAFVHSSRPVETATQSRPLENVKPRPTDFRYPPYLQPAPDRPYAPEYRPTVSHPEVQEYNVGLGSRIPDFNKKRPESTNYNKFQVQISQPSKVENHFIKLSPEQENPSYSLQTSFSIGVPPSEENQSGTKMSQMGGQGVGQVLFPEEDQKPLWSVEEEKRPLPDADKYPRPPWESHLKPPLVFSHIKKDSYVSKRPKPRPDLPNILPQFRPNAKIGHAEPHIYLKTPLDTLQPPPPPRPQFLRAESPEEELVHRRYGQSPRFPNVPLISAPKRGSLRSEDDKADPVFVVYPSNNAHDGVVVGTRGPQNPLPPDNLDVEDSFPLDTNKNFQARVDTPILKVKPNPKPLVKNEFPYPLVKPTEIEEKAITSITKEYTAFSPTQSSLEKEHDTEINVIPYLQDYMPFATKKPTPDIQSWSLGDDMKPLSVTLKTRTEETTSKIKIDNHKTNENIPTPQEFQAPFHASLTAPSQGWSVVRPRPTDTEKTEETTTEKPEEETEGTFDIHNFKPQLFGGFKPILPPVDEKTENKDKA